MMLGYVMLGILILIEIVFLVLSLSKRSNLKREKSIARIIMLAVFLLLAVSTVINWGFQWYMLGTVLLVQAILGVIFLVRKKENTAPKVGRVIFTGFNRVLLVVLAVFPILVFPKYDQIKPTGDYQVATKSYTLTDTSREEYFTQEKDNRKVTIQYWYPSEEGNIAKGKFPLVIFSHGAFGYRMSNYSTFQELASHGYIVCSIDHTYQAFMTKQEDGGTVLVNLDFLNSAMGAQSGQISPDETYKLEQEWMKLRTGDMKFVLDYIKKTAASANAAPVYQAMDLGNIGVFGHSLGGATAAAIGRDDKDVDAVIVIDGTMLGEVTGFENGKELVTDRPYPKPIMNIYSESHYNDAVAAKDVYANMVASKNALDSHQIVVKGSGHMSFTDLSIISPFISKMLETGNVDVSVDARYCLENMNKAVLDFFDHYLKNSSVEIPKERAL